MDSSIEMSSSPEIDEDSDTNKGNMWVLDQKLDQPMDEEAGRLRNTYFEKVSTKTESNKNAGNAILYECVETIMSIEDNGGLRVLAINILGRFLSNRDNNIRYVALNMLMRAITVDAQAVQRHRATILECVKDSDATSIQKRALELVFLLVNESNVKSLTKELLDYLEVSDQEFREDLTAKIYSIVEKFSPEKIWYIDQMLKVLTEDFSGEALVELDG